MIVKAGPETFSMLIRPALPTCWVAPVVALAPFA
jgi:hypothetical protein